MTEKPYFIIREFKSDDYFEVIPEECFPTYEAAVSALHETDFGAGDECEYYIVKTVSVFAYVKELRLKDILDVHRDKLTG